MPEQDGAKAIGFPLRRGRDDAPHIKLGPAGRVFFTAVRRTRALTP